MRSAPFKDVFCVKSKLNHIRELVGQAFAVEVRDVGKGEHAGDGIARFALTEIEHGDARMVNIEHRPEIDGRDIEHIGEPGHTEAVVAEHRDALLGMIEYFIPHSLVLIAECFQKRVRFATDTFEPLLCVTEVKGERLVPLLAERDSLFCTEASRLDTERPAAAVIVFGVLEHKILRGVCFLHPIAKHYLLARKLAGWSCGILRATACARKYLIYSVHRKTFTDGKSLSFSLFGKAVGAIYRVAVTYYV